MQKQKRILKQKQGPRNSNVSQIHRHLVQVFPTFGCLRGWSHKARNKKQISLVPYTSDPGRRTKASAPVIFFFPNLWGDSGGYEVVWSGLKRRN
ncbi:hypothetical protein O6P43_034179 [Quillaja saponaria]|uniref:Uncharacterized protein n=1 Tax=Quillaja saponaria TaxID=32244 RepID=A0AAD7KTV5_QUISA|nr:hypothetical protein O6P43_034179 [Quillaja saponaria]